MLGKHNTEGGGAVVGTAPHRIPGLWGDKGEGKTMGLRKEGKKGRNM